MDKRKKRNEDRRRRYKCKREADLIMKRVNLIVEEEIKRNVDALRSEKTCSQEVVLNEHANNYNCYSIDKVENNFDANNCHSMDLVGNNIDECMEQLNSDSESHYSDSDISDACEENQMSPDEFIQKLARWKVDRGISEVAMRFLLSLLSSFLTFLPLDPRTLVSKLQPCIPVPSIVDYENMIHIKLVNAIQYIMNLYHKKGISPAKNSFSLKLFIDGLSLFHSTKKGFWVILGSIGGIYPNEDIFLISVAEGQKKPNIKSFLDPICSDLNELTNLGINFNGVTYTCKAKHIVIVADSQARQFIKQIKVGGYYSCEVCCVKGRSHNRRMIFTEKYKLPEQKEKNFQTYTNHVNSISPLCNVDGFRIIRNIPRDPMHLLFLGITKRILLHLIGGKNLDKNAKLRSRDILSINEHIVQCSTFLPCEFKRRARPITEVGYYKASEFRTFLLYIGIVVLKGRVTRKFFRHFLLFSLSTRILCSEALSALSDLCEDMLDKFVFNSEKIFGKSFMTYNTHALIHLYKDYINHGNLENFSAFKFESYFKKVKKIIRSGKSPLKQLTSQFNSGYFQPIITEHKVTSEIKVLKQIRHTEKYRKLCFKGFTFDT